MRAAPVLHAGGLRADRLSNDDRTLRHGPIPSGAYRKASDLKPRRLPDLVVPLRDQIGSNADDAWSSPLREFARTVQESLGEALDSTADRFSTWGSGVQAEDFGSTSIDAILRLDWECDLDAQAAASAGLLPHWPTSAAPDRAIPTALANLSTHAEEQSFWILPKRGCDDSRLHVPLAAEQVGGLACSVSRKADTFQSMVALESTQTQEVQVVRIHRTGTAGAQSHWRQHVAARPVGGGLTLIPTAGCRVVTDAPDWRCHQSRASGWLLRVTLVRLYVSDQQPGMVAKGVEGCRDCCLRGRAPVLWSRPMAGHSMLC